MTTPTTLQRMATRAELTPHLATRAGARAARQALVGRVLSGLALAFLLVDTGVKVAGLPQAVESTVQLGYPAGAVLGIGLVELACVLLYAVPRTAVFGALLLTGYLGGAVATQVRAGSPLLSHVLFPIYVAALAWGGLYLRDARLRALVPLRR